MGDQYQVINVCERTNGIQTHKKNKKLGINTRESYLWKRAECPNFDSLTVE